jgi:hypothetical protein
MQSGVVLTHCYEGNLVQLLARFYLDGQYITKAIVLQAPAEFLAGLSPHKNTLAEYEAAHEAYIASQGATSLE